MKLIDAHQDIAWNILTFGRNYMRSAHETRQIERGGLAPQVNGDSLLGYPDYQNGKVALVFCSLFASPIRHKQGEWDRQCYADFREAARMYSAQLDSYKHLIDDHPDKFRMVLSQGDLADVLSGWEADGSNPEGLEADADIRTADRPVGLVVLMEGAEAVSEPAEVADWWARGVRIIGPAWAGTRFCGGTHEPGPMTKEGRELLDAMAEFGTGLDLSHMDETAALQALDAYPGQILASHSNALAVVKGSNSNRHLTDRLIQGIIERDGVIGVVPFNAFLKADWKGGDPRQDVTIDHLCAQIDYICQMAGDARHVAIGTDFDGGFGVQSVPAEIDTIADLQKLGPALSERGYSQSDLADILANNWLGCLRKILPN